MTRPFGWDPATLIESAENWVLNLEDFPQTLSVVRKLGTSGQTWLEHEELLQPANWKVWLGESKSLVTRIRELLFEDTGITVLKCGTARDGNEARMVELLVGCALGQNVTMNPGTSKRPLFKVTRSEDPKAGNKYDGNGLKANAIGLHTDGSGTIDRQVEVLSMLYLQPARFGGQSVVANSQLAFDGLTPKIKEILQRSFPRQNPYKGEVPPTKLICSPVYERSNGPLEVMEFSYHPERIRNGVNLARAVGDDLEKFASNPERLPGKLTEDESIALRELEEALVNASCEISLMTNEILLLNNRIVTHDRRAFCDDPRAPRLMERFWAGKMRTGESGHHRVGEATCPSCVL